MSSTDDSNTNPVETSKNDSNWGGKREGAGRPRGTENKDTKARRIAEQHMKARIVGATDALLNAQMSLAQGETSLYRVYYTGQGSKRQKHVEIVTDQETISEYLADNLQDSEDDYYYIATKSPDTRSIDSLFDRAYGRATQSVDLTSDGEKIQPVQVVDLGALHADKSETEPDSPSDQG